MKCVNLMRGLMFCVLPALVQAETVEIPLTGLQGLYYFDTMCHCDRQVRFRMDRLPISVEGVWIRISGTLSLGEYKCNFGGSMPEGPYTYGMEFLAIMYDTVSGNPWGADRVSPLQSGEFEYTMPFSEIYGLPVTWDFLKGGHGNIDFLGMPAMLLVDCWPTIWPSATIAEAVLIIEGEFEVSVNHASWGSIKALFR